MGIIYLTFVAKYVSRKKIKYKINTVCEKSIYIYIYNYDSSSNNENQYLKIKYI